MNNFIKKVLKNKKIICFSILGFIGLFFLFPKVAHADFFGIMDIFSMQLDALDPLDNTIRKYLIDFALWLAGSIAFVTASSGLLGAAMSAQVGLSGNPLVLTGWNFISAIANLVIIISFVWTALTMIIQGDSAKGQATLIRLIIIALVVNFSFFAMGALVDLAGFFQGALLNAFVGDGNGTSLISTALNASAQYSHISLVTVIGLSIAQIISSLIPIGNVAIIVITGISFITLSATGFVPIMVFTIILNFVMGAMFFLLAGVLLMRIIVLWMLTITAPLAIVTYKTEIPILDKFSEEWVKTLSEWLFVGAIYVFFLGLGFRLLTINYTGMAGSGITFGVMPVFFINYIFLVLYLLAVYFVISKKIMPSMASTMFQQATKYAGGFAKNRLLPDIKRTGLEMEANVEQMVADKQAYNQTLEEDRSTMSASEFDSAHPEVNLKKRMEANRNILSKEEFRKRYPEELESEINRKNHQVPGLKGLELLTKPSSLYRTYAKREFAGARGELAALQKDVSKKYENFGVEDLNKMIENSMVSDKDLALMFKGASVSKVQKFLKQNANNKEVMARVARTVRTGGDEIRGKIQRASLFGDSNDSVRAALFGNGDIEKIVKNATGDKFLDINTDAFKGTSLDSQKIRRIAAQNLTGVEFGKRIRSDGEFLRALMDPTVKADLLTYANPSLKKYLETKVYSIGSRTRGTP